MEYKLGRKFDKVTELSPTKKVITKKKLGIKIHRKSEGKYHPEREKERK
jgi:hypothetical protein